MTRRSLVIAALVAVAMVAAAVYGTFWILRQPVPGDDAEPSSSVASASASASGSEDDAGDTSATTSTGAGRIQVKLYVLAASGLQLATETREIPFESSAQLQAKRVMELLLERSAAIPAGVELRELFVTSQGVAYVDLSREVVANHPGGSSAEELTVFSLTHTLIANFPAVKAVKILVEGREVQTLAGHLDLTVPYGRAPVYLQPDSERPESQNEAG